MQPTVSMVIVSHSPLVSRGAADIVQEMVGDQVAVASCGGHPDGSLGTSQTDIDRAIRSVFGPAGVVVLVDLGAAETNSEQAIAELPDDMRRQVVIADAPVVEGAIMAAIESASGSPLVKVRASAEESRS